MSVKTYFFVQCLTILKAKFNAAWCSFVILLITENEFFLEHAARLTTPSEPPAYNRVPNGTHCHAKDALCSHEIKLNL